jgi:hypothetical protein
MKTTIDISEPLMQACKQLAQEEGVTFRALVEEGLAKVVESRASRKPFRLGSVPALGGGFRPGYEEGDWARIRDAAYEGRGA